MAGVIPRRRTPQPSTGLLICINVRLRHFIWHCQTIFSMYLRLPYSLKCQPQKKNNHGRTRPELRSTLLVMPQRLAFFNCTQRQSETITDFETRIRGIANKTKYGVMTDPLNELMRDRLCTGVENTDLRQLLLHHYKDDGETPLTFEEQLNKAKSWEAAHNTNLTIMQATVSKGEEHVNYTANRGPKRYQRQTWQRPTDTSSSKPCGWCGGPRHSKKECPASQPGNYCTNCYMTENHLTTACRSPKDKYKTEFMSQRSKSAKQHTVKQAHAIQFSPSHSDDDDYVAHSFTAYAMNNMSSKGDKYFTWLPVSVSPKKTVKVLMQVDSAATCNTLPSSIYEKLACLDGLKPSNAKILPYSGNLIHPLGKQILACEGPNSFKSLEFQVIDSADIPGKPPLLSGKDSEMLGLIKFHQNKVFSSSSSHINPPSQTLLPHVNTVSTTNLDIPPVPCSLKPGSITESQLKQAFKENFEGLGCVGQPVHLTLNPEVTPFHAGIHRVPVSKRDMVKEKIDEMVQAGKLKKETTPTKWCNNMTVVEKTRSDGTTKLRLCLDPSQTINKAVIIPHYQIPTVTELLPQLAGKKYKTFSIFDALDGFTQITLDEESSMHTAMHTPWGRYRWLRLPYGISSAPEEFQLRMHEAIEGLDGVACIADDILVVGQGDTRDEADIAHDRRVIALMHRAKEKNLKFNPSKIQFKLQKIAFMGSIVSEKGMLPDPAKVKAITEMPSPKDKQGVLRFCGMLNYLNNFCPQLSQTLQSLFDLAKTDTPFEWLDHHQKAFEAAQRLITQAPCLSYFDCKKSITLQVDASQGGLGTALMQPDAHSKLQPVAFTSCQMRPNEEKWAQIEKECLAIVAACDKWDLWLYGQSVMVQTDHQALETIFKKPLRNAPRRLQRMMMRLQRYRLNVCYKRGSTMLLADTLSRATLPTTNDCKQTNFELFRIILDDDPIPPGVTSRTFSKVKQETAADKNLLDLTEVIVTGWPELKTELPPGLSPYWSYRDELTVCDGVVYKGLRVVIPGTMRKDMLQKNTHFTFWS